MIDLGTGDGRAVLLEAARDPDALVIGVDAVAEVMSDSSRRASRSTARGGRPNTVFLLSGVELLPAGLAGIADLVTIRFPWGSLLEGALGRSSLVATIANLVRAGGTLEISTSLIDHDPPLGSGRGWIDLAQVEASYASLGFALTEVRPITRADLDDLASTWAGRLRVGVDRPALLFRFGRVRAGIRPGSQVAIRGEQ